MFPPTILRSENVWKAHTFGKDLRLFLTLRPSPYMPVLKVRKVRRKKTINKWHIFLVLNLLELDLGSC